MALVIGGQAALAVESAGQSTRYSRPTVVPASADNIPNIQYAGLSFDPVAEAEQAQSISDRIRGMHNAPHGSIPQSPRPVPTVAINTQLQGMHEAPNGPVPARTQLGPQAAGQQSLQMSRADLASVAVNEQLTTMGMPAPADDSMPAAVAPIEVEEQLQIMRQHAAIYGPQPQPAADSLAIADDIQLMNKPVALGGPGYTDAEIAGINGRIQGMHHPAAQSPVQMVSQQVADEIPTEVAQPVLADSPPEPEVIERAPSYAGPHPVAEPDRYYSLAPPCMGCPNLPCQSGATSVCGVQCGRPGAACNATWADARQIPWSMFGPGEYVGPARPEHVSNYYLRVNDLLTLTFIESRTERSDRYRFGVGDRLQIEWIRGASETDPTLDRELLVQPDGTISLPLINDAVAAGKTVDELQAELVKRYEEQGLREPMIAITPLETNTAIQDLLSAVVGRNASAGQVQDLTVTPEGTIQAAGIGSVYVQGLTLEELRAELEARYTAVFGPGLKVTPALTERATSYVFVGGEVVSPGRYTLEGPTTVMQAIALAGGWNNGGNLREVVVFRRDENWCLKATKINIRAPFYGSDPCPSKDVWLRDNDLIVVPKTKILCATDLIELYFTRGVYAVFPTSYVYNLNQGSTIVP